MSVEPTCYADLMASAIRPRFTSGLDLRNPGIRLVLVGI